VRAACCRRCSPRSVQPAMRELREQTKQLAPHRGSGADYRRTRHGARGLCALHSLAQPALRRPFVRSSAGSITDESASRGVLGPEVPGGSQGPARAGRARRAVHQPKLGDLAPRPSDCCSRLDTGSFHGRAAHAGEMRRADDLPPRNPVREPRRRTVPPGPVVAAERAEPARTAAARLRGGRPSCCVTRSTGSSMIAACRSALQRGRQNRPAQLSVPGNMRELKNLVTACDRRGTTTSASTRSSARSRHKRPWTSRFVSKTALAAAAPKPASTSSAPT